MVVGGRTIAQPRLVSSPRLRLPPLSSRPSPDPRDRRVRGFASGPAAARVRLADCSIGAFALVVASRVEVAPSAGLEVTRDFIAPASLLHDHGHSHAELGVARHAAVRVVAARREGAQADRLRLAGIRHKMDPQRGHGQIVRDAAGGGVVQG